VGETYCAFPDGSINPAIYEESAHGVCSLYAKEGEACNGPEGIPCRKVSEFKKFETQCSTDTVDDLNNWSGFVKKGSRSLGKCEKVTKRKKGRECCDNCIPCEDGLKCTSGFKNEWNFPISKCL
jgi:hypothetical protein